MISWQGTVAATLVAVTTGCSLDTFGISGTPDGGDTTTANTTAGTSSPGATTTAGSTTTTTGMPTSSGGTTEDGEDDTSTGEAGPHPELYPYDRTHSPITAYVAERMRSIAPAPDTAMNVFAKVGGTSTASVSFMQCLSTDAAIMELPVELLAARDFFNIDLGAGITPFTRESQAAMPAWTSNAFTAGDPTPIGLELAAIKPRFAHVLIGTHDLADAQPVQLFDFADNLLDTVDELMAGGVVPILSTVPQRTDMPLKMPYIPRYNGVIRAAAQGRQIPLVDTEYALRYLPMTGLAADGIDLSVFVSAMVDRPCFFDENGLSYGYNLRNLESLRALDRARQVVVDLVAELDVPMPGLAGSGTLTNPFEIPSLPFVDLRSTADSLSDLVVAYGGACDPGQDESDARCSDRSARPRIRPRGGQRRHPRAGRA